MRKLQGYDKTFELLQCVPNAERRGGGLHRRRQRVRLVQQHLAGAEPLRRGVAAADAGQPHRVKGPQQDRHDELLGLQVQALKDSLIGIIFRKILNSYLY